MNGYSVVLPLKYDQVDGPYLMNKEIKKVIQQNLKMLILTNPGERVMDTDYGIGVKSLLFHNRTDSVSEINMDAIIRRKVQKYMSFITIEEITFSDDIPNELNTVFLSVSYRVPSIKIADNISIILNK